MRLRLIHKIILQVYFRRATILNNAGSVEDALKVFLHCLSLDEGFVLAKVEAKKVLTHSYKYLLWSDLFFLRN